MALADEIQYRLRLDLGNYFRSATNDTRRKAGRFFREIADTYANEFVNGPWLERANRRLAATMREATVVAYQTNVIAEKAAPSYREGQGRFPGELLDVLEDPGFAVGTRNQIGFIDVGALNSRAVFWARLNFGAAPAVGSRPAPSARLQFGGNPRLQFGGNQGFTLRLTDPPSHGFNVPERPARRGFFNEEGQFFPGGRGEGAIRVSGKPSRRGIGARRFLDAGLVALAQNFKQVYHEELQDAARAAAARKNLY